MQFRYLVVDQNYLRTESLRAILTEQHDIRIVLPDMAMLEMTKSDKRELTVQQSLQALACHPSRIFVSRATSECLKYELENGCPVTGHLCFREATQFLRSVLLAVATGTPTEEYLRVVKDPEDHLSGLKQDYLSHHVNKERSLELVDATKREMSNEFAKRVRGARATHEERLAFVREKAPSLLFDVLLDNGFRREKARGLIRRKPMLLRYFYVKLWACLEWEEQGRLEGMAGKKISNDLLDHEYILAATFFDGVLSDEPRVNKAYQAVSALLATRV